MEDIARVLLDWRVLLIGSSLLFVLPLIFYLSSLDKAPVKVRKIRTRVKKARSIPAVTLREEAPKRLPEEPRRVPRKRPPAAPVEGKTKQAERARPEEGQAQQGEAPKRFDEPEANS